VDVVAAVGADEEAASAAEPGRPAALERGARHSLRTAEAASEAASAVFVRRPTLPPRGLDALGGRQGSLHPRDPRR
jgi:hypothetical protein